MSAQRTRPKFEKAKPRRRMESAMKFMNTTTVAGIEPKRLAYIRTMKKST